MATTEKPFGLIHDLGGIERDVKDHLQNMRANVDNVRWLIEMHETLNELQRKAVLASLNDTLLLIKKVIGG